MSIIQGSAKQASVRGFYPYTIEGSLRFSGGSNSDQLEFTPTSAGNRKTWTWSSWVKLGTMSNNDSEIFGTESEGDVLNFYDNRIFFFQNGSASSYISTSRKFRDPSAWYHIVFALDTTQATASNRCKLWVNGESVAFDSNTTFPTQNYDGDWMNTEKHYIGRGHAANNFDGYMAEIHFCDGQTYTADDFGEYKNGVWVAKAPEVTYGTNGFYLNFQDDTEVEAFNTVLYRGTGAIQPVTGVGFQPDLVWGKSRSNALNHFLVDSVRGPRNVMKSNLTDADEDQKTSCIGSLDLDGFTMGTSGGFNGSGYTYVAWCWDAGANNAVTGHSSVTYSGNSGVQRISGFPFSPDLVWIKGRDVAENHYIVDTVRGAGRHIRSDQTTAESSVDAGLTSFDKDGFVLGNTQQTNSSSYDYVAWGWDAGDSDPVSNTDGSITSTVKASQANGFSIVSWTGTGANATVGHGLSSAPDLVIVKSRTHASSWRVWSNALSGDQYLVLDATNAVGTQAAAWNSTTPTSSVFSVGTAGDTNSSGNNFITYCWHNVTGKQKFGTYTGTSASGNTITTGFRPGFVMIKCTTRGEFYDHWTIIDSSRDPLNPAYSSLFPNGNYSENTTEANRSVTFTDTGFTINSSSIYINDSSEDYIYAAFAGSYSDYITDYNTDGSIDSRVKANDTTGFSIVSYTGTGANGTVGHGLSSAPDFTIIKNRDISASWIVFHSSRSGERGILDGTNSFAATTNYYTSDPTDTVLNLSGATTNVNGSGNDHIAYCWTETTGYSKFGSYTGNGSTDGPEITTGFKPAMVILKNASNTSDWRIYDNTRDADKIGDKDLYPNSSSAEGSGSNAVQFNSDGFKLIFAGGSGLNTSGNTYIYAAFADTREAAFWLDQSGNDNDWQPNNLDHNDTVADSPTDNFATWNPLAKLGSVALPTFSDGNLTLTTNASVDTMAVATMGITSGTFYYEATLRSANTYHQFGVASKTDSITTSTDRVTYFGFNGYIYNNATSTSGYGTNSAGDVLGVACDADAGTVKFYLNNTLLSTESWTSNTGLYIPFMAGSNGTYTADVNFGQQPFKYDPPA